MLSSNTFAGLCLNMSVYNNITTNTISSNGYAILLQGSNYTNVIDNTGENNTYDIKEINCLYNYFLGNFIPNTQTRDSDKKETPDTLVSIDFTVVILTNLAISFLVFIFRTRFG